MTAWLGAIDLGALRARLGLPTAGRRPGAAAGPDLAPRPIGLAAVIDGHGALGRACDAIAGLRSGSGEVVVLAAATPMTIRGDLLRDVIEELAGRRFAVRWAVLGPADGAVHADQQTVALASAAAAGASCAVTVGSGTITDIGKAAAPAGTPLVAVQTATSVNGYADPFSVLLRDGVKRTTPTRWPDVLVIDHDVLAGAPAELNRAGVGDMAAMFTASADWYLAAAVSAGGPPYLAEVADLVRPHGERMFGLGDGVAEHAAELARLLTLSGITMGVAGSTAPASGMEHAISHLLEMAAGAPGAGRGGPGGPGTRGVPGRPSLPGNAHGELVGVASVIAAATWEHLLRRIAAGALGRPARLPEPGLAAERIAAAFSSLDPSGNMAAECLADYTAKLRLLAGRPDPLAALRARWPAHGAALGDLLAGPGTIAAGLRRAGLPATFAELPVPVDDRTARWAVANCALQRRRFGAADLAMLLGAWTDDDVDAVLAAAGVLS